MGFKQWRENRRLYKQAFPGPSWEEVGMFVGGLTAAVCVWSEVERRGGVVAVVLVALTAWGTWSAYETISMLKWRLSELRAAKPPTAAPQASPNPPGPTTLRPGSRAYDPTYRPTKTMAQLAAENPDNQFLQDRLAEQQAKESAAKKP